LHREFVWQNAPRIWQDFGSALTFQTCLTQTKPVLPLSNKHGSQVKDQGRWQRCHNMHKKFPYWPTCDVSLLQTRLILGRISSKVLRIYCVSPEDVPSQLVSNFW
jgi:hypothetical protein